MLTTLLNTISSIENGQISLPNRIDGTFFGSKTDILNNILNNKKVCYIVIEIPKNAISGISKDLKTIQYCYNNDNNIFFSKNDLERITLTNNLTNILYIESIYLFDIEKKCILYANDNLEDITITLEFLND